MGLHGCNVSLACFYGINFKSKSWSLFSLKEPCISFATEAQEIPGVEYDSNHLGRSRGSNIDYKSRSAAGTTCRTSHSMATVCRLSRTVLYPPQFKSLQEWFHYAFANGEIDDSLDCVFVLPKIMRQRWTIGRLICRQ